MRYLSVLYASFRALMIATLAGGAGGAQAQLPPETAAWNEAQAAGTVEAYQRYLELYPVGPHAGDAFRAIIELTVAPDIPTRVAGIAALEMY